MTGQLQAAVRIVSATPNVVQLQPGKAVMLSVKGSGLKTIRSGALYRDKAGKQKVGRLGGVRCAGGVSRGRLTLAGRVKPGAYYIRLADSRGALASLPVRVTVTTQRSTASFGRRTTQAKPSGVKAANRLAMQLGWRSGTTDYATLIAPSNACTALVRRVCGDAEQCGSRAGCSSAKYLLERYNQTGHSADVEASCNASLEDGALFPVCSQ